MCRNRGATRIARRPLKPLNAGERGGKKAAAYCSTELGSPFLSAASPVHTTHRLSLEAELKVLVPSTPFL